jgi:hypothetical protein
MALAAIIDYMVHQATDAKYQEVCYLTYVDVLL